jgi:hypothetical protein
MKPDEDLLSNYISDEDLERIEKDIREGKNISEVLSTKEDLKKYFRDL